MQSIQGKLINNTSNLTNVNKRINKGSKSFKKKLKVILFILKKRQLFRDMIDILNTEKKQRSKYCQIQKKSSNSKFQGSNSPLKRSSVKLNPYQKEFVPYSISRVLQYYQYLLLFLRSSQQLYLLLKVSMENEEVLMLLGHPPPKDEAYLKK